MTLFSLKNFNNFEEFYSFFISLDILNLTKGSFILLSLSLVIISIFIISRLSGPLKQTLKILGKVVVGADTAASIYTGSKEVYKNTRKYLSNGESTKSSTNNSGSNSTQSDSNYSIQVNRPQVILVAQEVILTMLIQGINRLKNNFNKNLNKISNYHSFLFFSLCL